MRRTSQTSLRFVSNARHTLDGPSFLASPRATFWHSSSCLTLPSSLSPPSAELLSSTLNTSIHSVSCPARGLSVLSSPHPQDKEGIPYRIAGRDPPCPTRWDTPSGHRGGRMTNNDRKGGKFLAPRPPTALRFLILLSLAALLFPSSSRLRVMIQEGHRQHAFHLSPFHTSLPLTSLLHHHVLAPKH